MPRAALHDGAFSTYGVEQDKRKLHKRKKGFVPSPGTAVGNITSG